MTEEIKRSINIDRYEIVSNLCTIVKSAQNKNEITNNIERIRKLARNYQFLTYKETTAYKELLTAYYPVRDAKDTKSEKYENDCKTLAIAANNLAAEMLENSPELAKCLPQKRQKVLVDFSNLKDALDGKFEVKKTHTIKGIDFDVVKQKPKMLEFNKWAMELVDFSTNIINVNLDVFNSYKCGRDKTVTIDWDMGCVNISTQAYIHKVALENLGISSGIYSNKEMQKFSIDNNIKEFSKSGEFVYIVRIKKLHTEKNAIICVFRIPTAELSLNYNSSIARLRTLHDNEEEA